MIDWRIAANCNYYLLVVSYEFNKEIENEKLILVIKTIEMK